MSLEIFTQVKHLFFSLGIEEQRALYSELCPIENKKEQLLDFKTPQECPHCKSKSIIKHSFYKEIQRYKCKECRHTFSATTGSVLAHLKKKDGFLEYVNLVSSDGLLTLAKVCEKLNISQQTSLDWRHKYLQSLGKKKEKFQGDVQADDVWFSYSQKGRKGLKYSRERGGIKRKGDNDFQVKVLVMADSNKNNWMETIKIGRISTQDVLLSVGDKFKKNQKLISDKHATYGAFAKSLDLQWVSFISKDHMAQTGENIQYVNSLASQLKGKINQFHRGVSTKYLNLYVGYFSRNKKEKITLPYLMKSENTWSKFIHHEEQYEKFIHQKSKRTYRCPIKRNWKSQHWL